MSKFGHYVGEVEVRWLRHDGDDRNMQLLADFAYVDQHGRRWDARKGSVVNGASIPGVLWSSVGSPYTGDYRRATVLHDVACDEKKAGHEDVHRMFYNAMRADGVGWTRGNMMYQAVKQFGPKWNLNGGAALSQPRRRASEEEMLRYLAAVEQAARELGESATLDEVERRAERLAAPTSGIPVAAVPSAPGGVRASRVGVRRSAAADVPAPTPAAGSTMLELGPRETKRQLAGTSSLAEFRKASPLKHAILESSAAFTADADAAPAAGDLDLQARLRLVEQALVLIEQNYVHLPMKEAMHAVDPVQKLRLLRARLRNAAPDALDDIALFHRELSTIFLSTRDLHTNYFLPDPFAGRVVFLPFLVEAFFDDDESGGRRRYMVTRLFQGFQEPGFVPGVEILRWNGIPIARAVEINGDRFAGSNPEARRARGIETLTVRSLVQELPPEEDFVIVEYRTLAGAIAELRVDWFTFEPGVNGAAAAGTKLPPELAVAQAIDLEQTIVRQAKKLLFAPHAVAQSAKMAKRTAPLKGQELVSLTPDVLEARPVTTTAGEYGYIRIRTFSVDDADAFVAEFVRLAGLLPQRGLIIDVRGNGGGLILAGEQLLQVLTPRRIEPSLFQIRNTPLNLELVERNGFLTAWRDSMRQAIATGANYSAGFPITPVAKANELGQRYHGPVILVTDGLCYSTTDIFAAGFQDHGIGPILGADGNTGAGGANVWDHNLLSDLLAGGNSPYLPLPSNAGMRVSIRRTIRTGRSNGNVLEDLGVVPDHPYRMTRRDLLESNPDLIEAAAAILATLPARVLRVQDIAIADGELDVALETRGLDRVDIHEGNRPLGSVNVVDGTNQFFIAKIDGAPLRFEGYTAGELVAALKWE